MTLFRVADRSMKLINSGEITKKKFTLHIYVGYNKVKGSLFLGACRIGHLVCVVIPAPQNYGGVQENPPLQSGLQGSPMAELLLQRKAWGFCI